MTNVVADVVRRVDCTLEQSSGRFPMSADQVTGEWTWSEDGEWFGGFWAGLLWLSAVATRDPKFAAAGRDAVAKLRPRTDASTVLRGLLYWYGAGLGSELGQAGCDVADVAIEAARSLSGTFDAVAQLLPPGEEDALHYNWPRPGACIDGLPGTVALLRFASEKTEDPTLRAIAVSDARGHYAMCVRPDGSVAQSATYDAVGKLTSRSAISGSSQHSTWARAQTWAMLGLTQAAHLSGELTHAATRVADWYLSHVPEDLVSYWDFDDPAIPVALRDTSATAIAAAALVKLAPLAGDRYRDAAQKTVNALHTRHIGVHGGLVDGCYGQRSSELIWGEYFLLEAALALDGILDTTRV